MATFSFNRTALCETQPKLHSMFCALFLKIALSADIVWSPRSCDLTPSDYYLWGAIKDKCYADNPGTNDALRTIFVSKTSHCLKVFDGPCTKISSKSKALSYQEMLSKAISSSYYACNVLQTTNAPLWHLTYVK